MLNKPKTCCFGNECNVFQSSSAGTTGSPCPNGRLIEKVFKRTSANFNPNLNPNPNSNSNPNPKAQ